MTIDELRKLRAEATQGEWRWWEGEFRGCIDVDISEEDATLAVVAVNHLGALLDVAELTAHLHRATCGCTERPHRNACKLALALARLEQTK